MDDGWQRLLQQKPKWESVKGRGKIALAEPRLLLKRQQIRRVSLTGFHLWITGPRAQSKAKKWASDRLYLIYLFQVTVTDALMKEVVASSKIPYLSSLEGQIAMDHCSPGSSCPFEQLLSV